MIRRRKRQSSSFSPATVSRLARRVESRTRVGKRLSTRGDTVAVLRARAQIACPTARTDGGAVDGLASLRHRAPGELVKGLCP